MIDFRLVGTDWAKLGAVLAHLDVRFREAVRRALMAEAHHLRGRMIEGFTSQAPGGQAFRPLSPITLAMRKARGFSGTKALIHTGTLRGSITVVHESGGTGIGGVVFVGVHRQAKAKGGKPLVNVAKIHEYGASWTMKFTPKMRKFLFAILKKYGPKGPAGRDKHGRFTRGKFVGKGGGGGGGTLTMHIPARPFVRPVLETYARPDDVRRRFIEHLMREMGGNFKRLTGG